MPVGVTAYGCLPSGYAYLRSFCLLLTELVFSGAAHWTHKVSRQSLELCSWLYAAVWSSLSLFINPSAYIANIFHSFLLYCIFSKSAAPCLHNGQIKSSGRTSPS